MVDISGSWIETADYEEIIYQALRDCPVHLGPDRSYPCLDHLAAGELILALGCSGEGGAGGAAGAGGAGVAAGAGGAGGAATLRPYGSSTRPADTWVQIDLDQWAPLTLEGVPYLVRHDLEGRP